MFYQLSSIHKVPVAGLQAHCAKLRRKQLGQITLTELVTLPESFGGIYLFYSSDGECLYVGKASRWAFSSRIPQHFDFRQDAWMNSFPKKLVKAEVCADLRSAVLCALKCEMCAFTFSSDQAAWDYAKDVETFLRSVLSPRLNTSNRHYDDTLSVSDHIRHA